MTRRVTAGALWLLVVAVTHVVAQTPAPAQERILSFVSDARVERNGDLLVTETIRVQAEGREIRRGILRDFPTIYARRDGTRVEVGFDVRSVTRDGATETFATERLQNGVRVRIGRADSFLARGPHTYVISYRTTRQIGFFPSFDELYWNATGTGWTFAIDVAEARITLPESVPFQQSAFYTGPQGATGKDARVVEQRPGLIVFRTTRPLPARNGLTVAAAWQKGVIAEPDAAQQMTWWLKDNLPLVVAGAGLVVLLGYYLVAWILVGRDPRRGTIIPLFAAPKGMSAAAVRYVSQMGFDNRTFAAAILDLGVRGHLKMTDSGIVTRLKRQQGGSALASAEQAMEAKLFGAGSTLELENSNHVRISGAQEALRDGLDDAYRALFSTNIWWSLGGVVGWLMLTAAIVTTIFVTRDVDYAGGFLVGVIFASLGTMVGTGFLRAASRGEIGAARLAVSMLFAVIFAGAGMSVIMAAAPNWVEALAGLAPMATVPIVTLGFSWLKAPSREGRAVIDQIEGLKLYLGTAEEERLDYLMPPEKTPQLFERFLPYAVALDVENRWAERFAAILAASAVGAAAMSWYSGQRDWTSDPGGFVDQLGSQLSETIAAASTAPGSSGGSGGSSSSGSSGGGSSGGGGGGGGGSGW